MVRMGRYDKMEDLEADVNETEKDTGWALHSWYACSEMIERRDERTGDRVTWPCTFFYAMFVAVPVQKKLGGMAAR